MLALVTGANGFVGSHLVDHLLRRGHRVRALVRSTSNLRHLDTQGTELCYGELADGEVPEETFDGVDVVFHVAALLHASSWEVIRRANVEASVTLFRRFAAVAPPEGRFVFVSSQAASGPSGKGPARREEDAPRPQSLYGKSKLEAEVALQAMQGPPLTIIRPPAVYGPRDSATLPLFSLASHGWAFCVGSPQREISMIHVDDLSDGLLQSASQPSGIGTFFLTDGFAHPWSEIARTLQSAAQRRVRVLTLPDVLVHMAGAINQGAHRLVGRSALFDRAKARDFTAQGWVCSTEAAQAAFDYVPQITLAEGMAATMEWYRKEKWL